MSVHRFNEDDPFTDIADGTPTPDQFEHVCHEREHRPIRGFTAISTHGDRRGEAVGSALKLQANEGLVLEPE